MNMVSVQDIMGFPLQYLFKSVQVCSIWFHAVEYLPNKVI